ncbi:MAG: Clp protease ClpP [Dermatophilaceae bacterium]|nr:Clp protease ClpP [Dermatophilaceae bacterium]
MDNTLYRFRGAMPPPAGCRASVLAAAPVQQEGAADGEVILRLYDPIDSWGGDWGVSAKEFAAALDAVPAGTARIRLHINSPGGEVFDALAILNLLRQHPAKVTAVVDGLAASAASFIAAGADEVLMGPNSQLMIHDARGVCLGPAADMRDLADLLDKISNNIASIYADRAGGTTAGWRAAMLAESWYTAQEAVDAGLADRITGGDAQGAPSDSFDLSAFGFRYSSRAEAPNPVPLLEQSGRPPRRTLRATRLRERARQLSR